MHSLEEFAASQPTLEQLEDISESLSSNYVAGGDVDMFEQRGIGATLRDKQNENMLLMHQYFLLYEELSYALNAGDIGRVETLFPPWIYLFKATGKHKYANHMQKFLCDLYYLYPERLRYVSAVQMPCLRH